MSEAERIRRTAIRRTADRIRTALVQSGAYTADTFYLERVLIREMSLLLNADE